MVDNISIDVPEYKEFFEEQEKYERIHVHVQSMRKKVKRTSFFLLDVVGGAIETVLGKSSYYVVAETVGAESGSTDFFPIGSFTFDPSTCDEPSWDQKGNVVGKKGKIEALKLSIYEDKKVLYSCTVPRSELGPDDADWLQFTKEDKVSKMVFKFRVRIASKPIQSKEDFESIYNDPNLKYEEIELTDDKTKRQEDSALLQAFRHKKGSKKAMLWILGRNDGFMHSHVFYRLLNEPKYDLYVLNYRSSARCIRKGWVEQPFFNSHCAAGNHDAYINEISKALKTIQDTKKYDTTIGYAHSTGAPIFLNYLMEVGDDGFDGFVFNSPFMDFGGQGAEIAANVVSGIGRFTTEFYFDPEVPEKVKGKCTYKGNNQELVLTAWTSKLYSEYYFNTGTRPVYAVPLTSGYMKSVEIVQDKVRARLASKNPITMKPFVLVSSRSDDTLDSEGMRVLIDAVGTARTEIELRDNSHDTFLSHDIRDSNISIDFVKVWLQRYNFY